MRGETSLEQDYKDILEFQSTHPMWGETGEVQNDIEQQMISIHSPHAG